MPASLDLFYKIVLPGVIKVRVVLKIDCATYETVVML